MLQVPQSFIASNGYIQKFKGQIGSLPQPKQPNPKKDK